MADASPIKNIFRLFVVGIIVGFFAGVGGAFYTVLVHKYLTYKLYLLIGDTFQKAINNGVGTAAAVCLIVTGIVAAAHIISRFTPLFKQHPARAKLLGVALLCLAVGIWAIDAVHQSWGYSIEHHTLIFWRYDIAIVLCVLALGRALMRMRLEKLASRIGGPFTFLLVFALIALCAVNGALYLYGDDGVSDRPNIILISIDTLRADHVGCYGYHRNTTPNIDAFARESVFFKNAFVHEPWTLPSHMSMLTGMYTITHGVYDWHMLDPRIPTLPEYLKNTGYVTLAFTNSFWLQPGAGFGKGFDQYINPKGGYSPNDPTREAEYQNRRIIAELKKNGNKPFFAFIHYYDVHSDFDRLPYDAPPPFDRMFTPTNVTDFPFMVPGVYASNYLFYINANNIALSDADRQYIVDLYDNGIVYMDQCIGELLENLKLMGLYDNTFVIITADHGEEFQEYGFLLHSNPYYYDSIIRVPLIVKLPQGPGLVKDLSLESVVELNDINPSILDYLDIKSVYKTPGQSFLDLITLEGAGKEYAYGLGSENWLYIRSKKWKLMSCDGLNRNRYRLFDLENDPGEQKDVAVEYPEIVEFLEKKLRTRIEESLELRARILGVRGVLKDSDSFKPDELQKDRLRSLGYVL